MLYTFLLLNVVKDQYFQVGLISNCTFSFTIFPVSSILRSPSPNDPHSRYFPTSTLCQLIRSSFSARGNFPQESSQWKICTMANKNIEDNEEIVKRNLVTIALCGLVLITITIIGTNETSNNPPLTFRYLVYILCQVVIINIYHARKVKRFLDGLCNTSYLTQGCNLLKTRCGGKKIPRLYESFFPAALAALYQFMGRTD